MLNLLKRHSKDPQMIVKAGIATVFSLITILGGFTDLVYVPISNDRVIDVLIVAVMFASLIGGYWVAVPLALVWSLVTVYNLDNTYFSRDFWLMLPLREVFAISLVFFYARFRQMYKYSPYNVYRAVVAALLVRYTMSILVNVLSSDGSPWLLIVFQQFVVELAICCVFMSLIIKHLRQVHVLNGVRMRRRKDDGNIKPINT